MTHRNSAKTALVALAFVAILGVGGCPIANLIGGDGGSGGLFGPLGNLFGRTLTLRDVAPALDFPNVPAANVRVEVLNLSANDADIRLTMRVGGRQVHFSTRTIRPNGATIIVGPDRADTILWEARVFENPPRSIAPETRLLNRDFTGGQVVQFVIPAAVINDCDANGVDDSLQIDSDGDGRIDACDGCANDAAKTAPGACGCGVADSDSDSDGFFDCNDLCPNIPNTRDSDSDGTPDCLDACPNDAAKTNPGACGCGVVDRDADNDGLFDCVDPCVGGPDSGPNSNGDNDNDGTLNCLDGCPDDAAKTAPGACGCGRADTDENGNGVADCNEVRELEIQLLGLDSDVRLNRAAGFTFQVRIGNFGTNPTVLVLARRVGTIDNIIVSQSQAPLETREIMWNVDVEPGIYELNASVDDAGRNASTTAVGRLLVNAQPTLVFDSPTPNQLVARRADFTVAWAGDDSDDNALIDILLDQDGVVNGNETSLRSNVSEDDVNDRDFLVNPISLNIPAGEYFVVGIIRDPLTTVSVVGPRVCLTDRLAGRIPLSTLAADTYLRIAGAADQYERNRAFGVSVKFRDEAGPEDGGELLVGDPIAVRRINNVDVPTGLAYYFAGAPASGTPLTSRDADVRYRGDRVGAQLGARAEFRFAIKRLGGTLAPAAVLGAPLWSDVDDGYDGRAFWLGASGNTNGVIDLCCDPSIEARYDGRRGDQVGLDLCQLRDVSGDGVPDFAIGGTRANDPGLGFVTILDGNAAPNSGPLYTRGFTLYGTTDYGAFGFDIVALDDVDNDEFSDFAVSEPLAGFANGPLAGVVSVYFGQPMFDRSVRGNDIRTLRLLGEQNDDGAGYAMASGDFDDDGNTDLAVGAPFHDSARGRVYIISNIGGDLPNPLALRDVGSPAVPGAIIDGAHPGDCLGFSMARARAFDPDIIDDLVVGSPVADNERGSTWVIYGRRDLRGLRTLGPIDCDFPALELARDGDLAERLGHSVSSGDFNGDGGSDIAIGAPTSDTQGGAVYVIFGESD